MLSLKGTFKQEDLIILIDSLAILSTISFPSIPMWPGIHRNFICLPEKTKSDVREWIARLNCQTSDLKGLCMIEYNVDCESVIYTISKSVNLQITYNYVAKTNLY